LLDGHVPVVGGCREAEAQQRLDKALDEVAALKATVGELTQAGADAKAKEADAQQALKWERDQAHVGVAVLKEQPEPQHKIETWKSGWPRPLLIFIGLVIACLVVALWVYALTLK
jgi:hypothetical protein